MKLTPTQPMHKPMLNLSLKISTRIRLHHQFIKAPARFAVRHGVDLAGDVNPETCFAKDPDTRDKIAEVKANIHLVRYNAVRLFTKSDRDGDWIRGIDVNPSTLLYGVENHSLTEQDLLVSLSMVQSLVTPLLADPSDRCHIVPGLVVDDKHLAYWSHIKSVLQLPGIHIPLLHGIKHPDTGPPDGPIDERLQLGKKGDDCVITFDAAGIENTGGNCAHSVDVVHVSLFLKRQALLAAYQNLGTMASVHDKDRLVAFRAPDVARVHHEVMSRLEGFYLPVPLQWAGMGKPITTAKVIALLSQVTSIPRDELRAMYEGQSKLSDSTRKRLNNDLPAAAACFKPVPVSSLFRQEVYATQPTGKRHPVDVHIDPQITAAYGPHASSH